LKKRRERVQVNGTIFLMGNFPATHYGEVPARRSFINGEIDVEAGLYFASATAIDLP
jgi:hypothetical protein